MFLIGSPPTFLLRIWNAITWVSSSYMCTGVQFEFFWIPRLDTSLINCMSLNLFFFFLLTSCLLFVKLMECTTSLRAGSLLLPLEREPACRLMHYWLKDHTLPVPHSEFAINQSCLKSSPEKTISKSILLLTLVYS